MFGAESSCLRALSSQHNFKNLFKCKEIPFGEEPVGTFVTFHDLLLRIAVISDKNQTKAEIYKDHIFIRDDQIEQQIINSPASVPTVPSNESLSTVDECGNKCENGCFCGVFDKDERSSGPYQCINQPGRSFLGDSCEHSEPILRCGVDTIEIALTSYTHFITDWKSDGFLHLGNNPDNENCRFTNGSETLISYDQWAECGGQMEFMRQERFISGVAPESGIWNTQTPIGSTLQVKNVVKRDILDSKITYDDPLFEWECRYHLDVEPLHFLTFLPRFDSYAYTRETGTINAHMNFYNQRKSFLFIN